MTELILKYITTLLFALLTGVTIVLFVKHNRRTLLLHSLELIVPIIFFAYLLILSINQGRCPFGSIGEALLFVSWLISIVLFFADLKNRERTISIFIAPFAAGLFFLGELLRTKTEVLPATFFSYLFPLHVSFTLLGYVFLFFVFMFSAVYYNSFNSLKNKRYGFLFKRMPPLNKQTLYIDLFLLLGNISLVVGTLFGIYWSYSEHILNSTLKIKFATLFVSWIFFMTLFLKRKISSLSAFSTLLFSILGIAFLVITFLIGKHAF